MSDAIGVLTEATFDEEVGAAPVPVLVEFWAEWCGPCKLLGPILDDIATEQEGRLRVFKVNSDDEPGLGARFDVMSVPTLLVFTEGKLVKRMVGARGKRHLLEELADVVPAAVSP